MQYNTARPDDLEQLVALLVQAYHYDQQQTVDDLRQLGLGQVRVIRSGGRIEAALELIPVGQWFGGRRVPMGAVANVAVRLECRGVGRATQLMTGALEEMRAEGIALSTLFTSTPELYRKLGYELAGSLIRYDAPLGAIRLRLREGELVQVELEDRRELEAVYRAVAQQANGLLDRDPSFWEKRFDPLRWGPGAAYVARFDGQPEGYAILRLGIAERRLNVRDIMFTTRRAGERLLMLLADHAMQFDTVRWWGGPCDGLAYLLGGQQATPCPQHDWMLRIVDIAGALEGRGYAPAANGVLHLEVADPLIAANHGRWLIQIADGRATVQRGGEGRLRLGIGALAALYTGHATPGFLQRMGLLSGPADELDRAAVCFAGPSPYMVDGF